MVSTFQDSKTAKTIIKERRLRGLSRQRLSSISGYSYVTISLLERKGLGSRFLFQVILDSLNKIPRKDIKVVSSVNFINYIKKFYKKYRCSSYDLFPATKKGNKQAVNFNDSLRGSRFFSLELRESIKKRTCDIINHYNILGMNKCGYCFSLWIQRQMAMRNIEKKDLEKLTGLSSYRIDTYTTRTNNPRYHIIKKISDVVMAIPPA